MTSLPRQYGLWDSPLTPRSLAEGRRLDGACFDSNGRTLVWLEGRSGRGVLVAQEGGGAAPRDLTTDLDVRAEVGYGGGDFTVHGGWVYFVVNKTGRIYRQPVAAGRAEPVTPPFGQAAAPAVSPDGQWLVYVHSDEEQVDRLAIVDTHGRFWPQALLDRPPAPTGAARGTPAPQPDAPPLPKGHDFCMQPRWSPDGRRLAWIAWDHPNMPWDGTTLYLAEVEHTEGRLPRLKEPRPIAGGPDIAVFQPEFTPDGQRLLYVSDETGWGRLASFGLKTGERHWLTPEGIECGVPAWVQEMRTYAVLSDSRTVVVARNERGFHRVHRLDLATGASGPVEALQEYGDVASLAAAPEGARVVLIASGPQIPPRVLEHDLETGGTRVAARASGETVPGAALAECEPVTWTTDGGEQAHGLFYAPRSDRYQGAGRPPLIVLIHGGPTSQVRAGWRGEAQYFATRGYGVLFVNYRGSTGYGREYMLRLRGNWGVCDVEDAVSGARHLADAGRVDPARTVIMGGSAGGFTVLQTMTTRPEAFAAGVCLYGVANQFGLASDTHKFESRYLDTLLGPLPEAAALYRERSPVFHAERIARPLALFQGEVDKVVPRDQSDAIAEALRRRGVPHVYHVYEGEGHGWRKRETIEHYYGAVEAFLRQHVIFGTGP